MYLKNDMIVFISCLFHVYFCLKIIHIMCRHMEFWEKHYFRHPTSVEGLNSSIVFLSCFLQRLALAGKSMINSCSRGEISQQGSLNLTVATALSFYSDSGHVKTSCKWLNHIQNICIWVKGIWQGASSLL